MSKRRRKKNRRNLTKKHKIIQRDIRYIPKSNRLLYDIQQKQTKKVLDVIQDRRVYLPPTDSSPRKTNGQRVSYANNLTTKGRVQFKDPANVMICKRRSDRRKTLFKLNKIGKGKKSTKQRRYNESSNIVCKRR